MTTPETDVLNGTDEARERLVSHLRSEAAALLAGASGPVQVVEVTAGDCAVRVERPVVAVAGGATAAGPVPAAAGAVAAGVAAPDTADHAAGDHHAVRAPLVGSFYRRPSPDAAPFVEIDDVVEAGQTLAIVEAMKLMNEIKSDRAGRVVAIHPGDGQMVEFDEVLVELAVDG
ncbi:acetyl-CoA carboxylase biotin carboxyl carrier protein [Jiangella gansuensis]|uniref:acetyl-CoA carboxylase biotin carboxyl carrier protein n=1 Tax=Jiangella gansuensis TaxID=281473 RepID=UPI0004B0B8D0|nr:biotin/lipoyl-containing protein [Jiangella gansuensis]